MPEPQYIPREQVATWQRYRALGNLFEGAFRVPGTSWRFGFDALLGLIPGLGDLIGAAAAGYGVILARRMGAPFALLLRMLGNIVLDTAGGAIPVLGDLFDFAFKSHTRNRLLLERWMAQPQRVARNSTLAICSLALLAVAALGGCVWLAIAALRGVAQLF